MLNPGFRLLDPEPEQLNRFASLSPICAQVEWRDELRALSRDQQETLAALVAASLAVPGVHSGEAVDEAWHTAAQTLGIQLSGRQLFGWPVTLLKNGLNRFQESITLVLGILDGDGIWAGGLAGLSQGGMDFLGTFRLLWNDEPELASRQSLADLPDLCRAVNRRFARPAGGVFIYRDEFIRWRDQVWSQEMLDLFVSQGTALVHRP